LGGAGFTPLLTIAGAGYIQHFLKHWRTPYEEAGKLLQIVFAWSQFQAGVSYPILAHPEKDLSYIDGRFINQIRHYLTLIQGKITLLDSYTPSPLRKHDKSIMDIATTLDFTTPKLQKINCVRMFLNVTYISEISTLDGTKIHASIQS